MSLHMAPAYRGVVLGRDDKVLNAGVLDLAHPLNLGRDRTGGCCAAWWAGHDAGRAPAWEDDGHHEASAEDRGGRPGGDGAGLNGPLS